MQCAVVILALAIAAATWVLLSWHHCALAGAALIWLHYTAISFRRFRADMGVRSSAKSVASIDGKPCVANVTFGPEASITIHSATPGDSGALGRLTNLSVPRVEVDEEFSRVNRTDGTREMVSRLQRPVEVSVEGSRVASKYAAIVERPSVAQRVGSRNSTVAVHEVDVPLRLLPGLHMLVHRAEASGPTRYGVACDPNEPRLGAMLTQRICRLQDTMRACGDSLGMGAGRRAAPTKWKVHAATHRHHMGRVMLLQRGDRYLVLDDTVTPEALSIGDLRSDYPQLAGVCEHAAAQVSITRRQLLADEHIAIHACEDGTYDATLHPYAIPKDYTRGGHVILRTCVNASTAVMGLAAILYCV